MKKKIAKLFLAGALFVSAFQSIDAQTKSPYDGDLTVYRGRDGSTRYTCATAVNLFNCKVANYSHEVIGGGGSEVQTVSSTLTY
jgi:hypothetical protein